MLPRIEASAGRIERMISVSGFAPVSSDDRR
jgi:hypothetical protein